MFRDSNLEIRGGHLGWEDVSTNGNVRAEIVGGIINRFLCLDMMIHGLATGRDRDLERLMT